MAKIDYPVTLTKKDWDKRKPLIAKTKATGIGALLKDLEKQHGSINWREFAMTSTMTAALERDFEEAKKLYASKVKPMAKDAKAIKDLADSWTAKYTKDKLIPKTAAKATKAIADAAEDFRKQVEAFDEEVKKEFEAQNKSNLDAVRKALKPMLTKTVQKCDLFLSDIAKLKSAPTKDNLMALATGDGGARGYCTGCKNWDQLLKNFPDIRDPIYKGTAMDEFFPAAKVYGANHDAKKWDEMLQETMQKYNKTEEEVIKQHAKRLGDEEANIKRFRGYLQQMLNALG